MALRARLLSRLLPVWTCVSHFSSSLASSGETTTVGLVRLSKRMAQLGLCSRREADVWIARGDVRVRAGLLATTTAADESDADVDTAGARAAPRDDDASSAATSHDAAVLGAKVPADTPLDAIAVRARAADEAAARARGGTVLLHKPVGYVSDITPPPPPPPCTRGGAARPPLDSALTLVRPASAWAPALEPPPPPREGAADVVSWPLVGFAVAGRLDAASSGLLVYTRDGRVARQLIGGGRQGERGRNDSDPAAQMEKECVRATRPAVHALRPRRARRDAMRAAGRVGHAAARDYGTPPPSRAARSNETLECHGRTLPPGRDAPKVVRRHCFMFGGTSYASAAPSAPPARRRHRRRRRRRARMDPSPRRRAHRPSSARARSAGFDTACGSTACSCAPPK